MISSDSITEIDGSEHGMVVERNSRLELTCRVTSGDRTPAFIIWQKENKVCSSQSQSPLRLWEGGILIFFSKDKEKVITSLKFLKS